MIADEVRFCPRCGAVLAAQAHFGCLRPTCPACKWIYFADPKVAVAVLVERENRLLLVRRVNDPQRGRWTLPAGFVDAGEDPACAAERECLEETGLEVKVTGLVDVLAGQEHPRGAHILIVYQARITGGEIQAGDDADGVGFFSPENLPPLAFQSTMQVIQKHWKTPTKA